MSLTLYQIMGDNMLIYAKKLANGDVNTTVVDEHTSRVVFCETGHSAAWEALVYFAKQIISENERIGLQSDLNLAEELQGQPYE